MFIYQFRFVMVYSYIDRLNLGIIIQRSFLFQTVVLGQSAKIGDQLGL